MRREAPSQGHHDFSDSDGSVHDGPPRGRRGIDGGIGDGVEGGRGGGGGGGRGEGRGGDDAGAFRSSMRRRTRRRQRAAAGQRAEDLKTYDPKAIGECPPPPRPTLRRPSGCLVVFTPRLVVLYTLSCCSWLLDGKPRLGGPRARAL